MAVRTITDSHLTNGISILKLSWWPTTIKTLKLNLTFKCSPVQLYFAVKLEI